MNKVVLVTGSSRGLGKETALLFASKGYDVIINYLKNEKLAIDLKNEIEKKYQVKVICIQCDVREEQQVSDMFDRIIRDFHVLNVVVNNAGLAIDNEIVNKSGKEFLDVISTNLLGTFLVSKYACNFMKNGSIINVSSANGIDTNYKESTDYDASKAGIISMTKNFSISYPSIRINAVAPGWIETPDTLNMSPIFKEIELNKIVLKRFAKPLEIANVIYFLASEESSYINGSVIRVDGGYNG